MSCTDGQELHRVATYSYACTAYVRTTLRQGLAVRDPRRVWPRYEYIRVARAMVQLPPTLPDVQVWRLTETEVLTIHYALEWRRQRRALGKADLSVGDSILREWEHIENEIDRVARSIWHARGQYWR